MILATIFWLTFCCSMNLSHALAVDDVAVARVRNRHGLSIFKVESLDRDEAARAAYYLWRI